MNRNKRVEITGPGGTDVLRLVEEEVPEPRPGRVRVRVLAAGVGYSDVMAQHGGYPLAPKVPFTPGYDFSGIVDQVGEGVTGISKGQYVAALNPAFGSYAQYVCLSPELLVPVPQQLDPGEVVGVILNYLTAHCILHRKAEIRPNDTVLIHAAGGGVGTALLQLGGALNLNMYGTASCGKHSVVRESGGIPIDYKRRDFVEYLQNVAPGGVDAAFDPIGGDNLRRSYKAVKKGGRVISYGFAGDRFGGLIPMILGMLQMNLLHAWPDGKRVRLCATPGEVKNDIDWYRDTLSELLAMLANREIQPLIGARVPLSEVARAHQLLELSEVSGKVVLLADA